MRGRERANISEDVDDLWSERFLAPRNYVPEVAEDLRDAFECAGARDERVLRGLQTVCSPRLADVEECVDHGANLFSFRS